MAPWGSGKTSTLKLVEAVLQPAETTEVSPTDVNPIDEGSARPPTWEISWLNPWLLSSPDAIVAELLACIQASLPEGGLGEKAWATLKKYAGYALPIARGAAATVPLAGQVAAPILERLENRDTQTLESAFNDLARELRALRTPILIVIDDVDRLQPDELLALLKCVRALGRLPNVHYLLAYDQPTLIDVLTRTALAHNNRARALAYLEKIVTVRLDQPPTRQARVDELLRHGLNEALAGASARITSDQSNRLAVEREQLLVPQLAEPRRVRRFLAQLHAYLPLVGVDEVDPVDFVVLTHLRLAFPELYAALSRDRRVLCGSDPSDERLDYWNDIKKLVADQDERRQILAALNRMYPVLSSSDSVVVALEYDSVRGDLRACDADYADRYFELNIEVEEWPDAALIQALEAWAAATTEDSGGIQRASLGRPGELIRLIMSDSDDSAVRCPPILRRLASRAEGLSADRAAYVLEYLLKATPSELADPLCPHPSRTSLVHLFATLLGRGYPRFATDVLTATCEPTTPLGRRRLSLFVQAARQLKQPARAGAAEAEVEDLKHLVDLASRLAEEGLVASISQPVGDDPEDFGSLWRWIGENQGVEWLSERLRGPMVNNGGLVTVASHFVELGRNLSTGAVEVMSFRASEFVALAGASFVEQSRQILVEATSVGSEQLSDRPTWENRRRVAARQLLKWLDSPEARESVVPDLVPSSNPTVTPLRNGLIASGGANVPDLQVGATFLLGERPPVQPSATRMRADVERLIREQVQKSPITEWMQASADKWHYSIGDMWTVEEFNGSTTWLLRPDINPSYRVGPEQVSPVDVRVQVRVGAAGGASNPAVEFGIVACFAMADLKEDRTLADQGFSGATLPSSLSTSELLGLVVALLACRTSAMNLWGALYPGQPGPVRFQTHIATQAGGGMAHVVDIGPPSVGRASTRPSLEVTYDSALDLTAWGLATWYPPDWMAAAAVVRDWARAEQRWIDAQVETDARAYQPRDPAFPRAQKDA